MAVTGLVALTLAVALSGGSGTYVANGHDLDVALFNSGTTAWRAFSIVAPPGLTFIGGTTGNEGSVSCAATGNTISCGPIGPTVIPSGGHLTFVGTMSAAPACGPAFELDVSADGTSYTRVGDLTPAADCVAPRALAPPTLRRVGTRIRATAPTWSSPPASVRYRWERCTASTCKTVSGATRLSLKLTRIDIGRRLRLVATATIDGAQIQTRSRLSATIGAVSTIP